MKLASLREGGRDGTLIVVSKDLNRYVKVGEIAETMQLAIENWEQLSPALKNVYEDLNQIAESGAVLTTEELAAPLPRAYQWLDGSAYLSHVERVRKARGAGMPDSFLTDPLMYQGASDDFLGASDPIYAADVAWGVDFEAEVGIMTDDVPMGVDRDQAAEHIKLIMLVNDVSLRNLIPAELAKGFGFIHGKPASSFSPVAVTPDELGTAWQNDKVHLDLVSTLNDELFGHPNAGEDMQFDFAQLISHAAKTRKLSAGTLIGSGTVSNQDLQRGCSCIVERRVLEIIATGEVITPFMQFGDRIRIAMLDAEGQSVFGAIDQEVQPWKN